MNADAQQLLQRIAALRSDAEREFAAADSAAAAEQCRVKYLGRKGEVSNLFPALGQASPEQRRELGAALNELKQFCEEQAQRTLQVLRSREISQKVAHESVDLSLPGRDLAWGHAHVLRSTMDRVMGIFTGLGFSVYDGPEIETDFHNFEALNMPLDHPARDMQDTFFVGDGRLLRTHTSPVQIHVMQALPPPIAMIAPGAVYRRDNDVSHSPMFHQVEGLLVDHGVSFGNLKAVIETFLQELFGSECGVRFRPSFFPFTEPSAEVDIACLLCGAKGCPVCKQTGWLEILGCGMVDPEVFRAVKYDVHNVSGFAFGIGIERVAMLLYGISDIRLMFENDVRFIQQF